jgi:hypothetical protein
MIKGWARGIGIFAAVMLVSVLVSTRLLPRHLHIATYGSRSSWRRTFRSPPRGLLGSLVSNQVDYLLALRRERSDSLLVLALTGPGPDLLSKRDRGNSQRQTCPVSPREQVAFMRGLSGPEECQTL